jgi:NAD dependent epimerase/dehydratase family enzyme
MPWIHLADHVAAVRFLIDHASASGPFNLIAPEPTSNEHFMRVLAGALRRPHWLPTPRWLLRLALGGMSDMVARGRFTRPGRLTGLGFRFRFPAARDAVFDLLGDL